MPSKFNYPHAQSTASRLIDKFGTAGLLRRSVKTGTAYDPTVSVVDYPVMLVDLEYAEALIDGTQIKRGDHKLYMSVSGQTPLTSDRLVFGGKELKIIDVKPLSPAGVDVYFEIHGRL